jgi:hypothetical protein
MVMKNWPFDPLMVTLLPEGWAYTNAFDAVQACRRRRSSRPDSNQNKH